MDGQRVNLDGLLQSVMSNPEMLKSAMELAGRLSENGGLQGLFAQGGEEKDASAEHTAQNGRPEWESASQGGGEDHGKQQETKNENAVLPLSASKRRRDMERHRKLLQALALYVNEEKRGKFELVIRLLDLMDFAGNVGL